MFSVTVMALDASTVFPFSIVSFLKMLKMPNLFHLSPGSSSSICSADLVTVPCIFPGSVPFYLLFEEEN